MHSTRTWKANASSIWTHGLEVSIRGFSSAIASLQAMSSPALSNHTQLAGGRPALTQPDTTIPEMVESHCQISVMLLPTP